MNFLHSQWEKKTNHWTFVKQNEKANGAKRAAFESNENMRKLVALLFFLRKGSSSNNNNNKHLCVSRKTEKRFQIYLYLFIFYLSWHMGERWIRETDFQISFLLLWMFLRSFAFLSFHGSADVWTHFELVSFFPWGNWMSVKEISFFFFRFLLCFQSSHSSDFPLDATHLIDFELEWRTCSNFGFVFDLKIVNSNLQWKRWILRKILNDSMGFPTLNHSSNESKLNVRRKRDGNVNFDFQT